MNEQLRDEITKAARELDVHPAALAAIADLETGLQAFAMVNDRQKPLIRFEGHYFDRRLSDGARKKARNQGLASPMAGAVANPASQGARWRLLAQAAAIDRKAAYESTSWGLGQVMGAHWAWLDYPSVEALADEALSVTGQLRMMRVYIAKAGLAGALRNGDWAGFAHGYNGPAFARNDYHNRLRKAYERHAASWMDGGRPVLQRGARGGEVRLLQTALRASGALLDVDGVFGTQTEAALRTFQAGKGLIVDGIAGPQSWAVLESYLTKTELAEPQTRWPWIAGILTNIAGIFRTAMRI